MKYLAKVEEKPQPAACSLTLSQMLTYLNLMSIDPYCWMWYRGALL